MKFISKDFLAKLIVRWAVSKINVQIIAWHYVSLHVLEKSTKPCFNR